MSDTRTHGALRLAFVPLGLALVSLPPLLYGGDDSLAPIDNVMLQTHTDGRDRLHALPLDPGRCGSVDELVADETASTVTLRMTNKPPGPGGHNCALASPAVVLQQPLGDRTVIDGSRYTRLSVYVGP